MPFEYFFDYQSVQFDFIRIPRVMMTEEVFAPLSMQAKIMYGMLLDRMNLSYKNKWVDEENKVYIVYPVNEMAKDMNISRRTVINCLGELMGLGLVDKKQMGTVRQSKDGKKMITIYSCLESFEPDGKVRSDWIIINFNLIGLFALAMSQGPSLLETLPNAATTSEHRECV